MFSYGPQNQLTSSWCVPDKEKNFSLTKRLHYIFVLFNLTGLIC